MSSLGVHHTGKDGKTLRGSSAFEGGADTVYFTSRDGAVITLDREKRNDGPDRPPQFGSTRSRNRQRRHFGPPGGGTNRPFRAGCLSTFVRHFPVTGATKPSFASWPKWHQAPSTARCRPADSGDLINTGTDKRPFYRRVSE